MKNIIDLTFELITENKKVTTKEIMKNIDNPGLINQTPSELEAIIANDLQTDGRFICVEGYWDFKVNYTMNEVIKEQYKTIGHIVELAELEDEDTVIEDIELVIETEEDNDEHIDPNDAVANFDDFGSLDND